MKRDVLNVWFISYFENRETEDEARCISMRYLNSKASREYRTWLFNSQSQELAFDLEVGCIVIYIENTIWSNILIILFYFECLFHENIRLQRKKEIDNEQTN